MRAERILVQVRLGQYRTKAERAAAEVARAAATETPYFQTFADEWLERRRVLGGRRGTGLSESGEADMRWRLDHAAAWFGGLCLADITEEEVERFAAAKRAAAVGDGGLGATSVNKVLSTMEAVLDSAVRYQLIERNPVAGYRVYAPKYVAAHLDTAEQMRTLLDAAEARDRRGRLRRGHGRQLLATLLFAGLRIDEALSLRWSDVNLATGTLRVRDGKTVNATRTVYLLAPAPRGTVRAEGAPRRWPRRPDLRYAARRQGQPVERRLADPEARDPGRERAPGRGGRGADPGAPGAALPRHTHVSVMLLLGEEAGYVADQVGHADAGFTYSRYRKRIERRDSELERLRGLFYGTTVEVADAATISGRLR